MDASPRARESTPDAARKALEEALDRYVSGRADLQAAAADVGMDQMDFVREATAMPDPAAIDMKDLPTFIRERR